MAREMQHPLSGHVYGLDQHGFVIVEKHGRSGRFRADGQWVDGEIRTADPELCQWIGGRQLAPGVNLFSMFGGEPAGTSIDGMPMDTQPLAESSPDRKETERA